MIPRLNPQSAVRLENATIEKAVKGSRPWILRIGLDKGIAQATYRVRTKRLALEMVDAYSDPDIYGHVLDKHRDDIRRI